MLREVISGSGTAIFAEIALVIFFLVFLGILGYVILRRRGAWDRVSRLPLDDDKRSDTTEDNGR